MTDGGPSLAFHPLYPEVKEELLADKSYAKLPHFENVDGSDLYEEVEEKETETASSAATTNGAPTLNGNGVHRTATNKVLSNDIAGYNPNGYDKQKNRRCCS
jgi:hypothetical protein